MTIYQRSLQVWSLLVAAARQRRRYTYLEVANILGYPHAPVVVPFLDTIFWYCVEQGLPPLTVLVVRQDTRQPGDGYLVDVDVETDTERVYAFDWFGVEPPETKDFRETRQRQKQLKVQLGS